MKTRNATNEIDNFLTGKALEEKARFHVALSDGVGIKPATASAPRPVANVARSDTPFQA